MKHKIIYADPAWQYTRNTGNGAAENHYKTMDLQAIKAMGTEVQAMSDPDTVLAMWATCPLLPQALEVMQAWGFKYKTVLFTWVKYNPKTDKYPIGGGSYTRAGSELCLLGVKTKIPERHDRSIRQVLLEPRQEHSRKPAIVRDHLVTIFGDVPRIELFAREMTPGWASHGNEVNKFIPDFLL